MRLGLLKISHLALLLRIRNIGQRKSSMNNRINTRRSGFYILQDAMWTKELKFSNFNMDGDCRNLTEYLNERISSISWQSKSILEAPKRITLSCLNFQDFFFIPKSGNNVVDTLAKQAKHYDYNLRGVRQLGFVKSSKGFLFERI